MAKSNIDRVGEALDAFCDAFRGFVYAGFQERHGGKAMVEVQSLLKQRPGNEPAPKSPQDWDAPAIIDLINAEWQYLFRKKLNQTDRSMLFELRDVRNRWAHRDAFSLSDTLRALDTIHRLLLGIGAAEEAERVQALHGEVMRARFSEMQRSETTRASRAATEGAPAAGLRPWREVMSPHPDVASGAFTNAEFAADLAQVHRGDAPPEYGDPKEFFRRTFLTEGLQGLLRNALVRLSGKGGHPVIELQTNFGGGKTHSMLALYHLLGGVKPGDLSGVEPIVESSGVTETPKAKRAVLVGTRMSPGQAEEAPDGLRLCTMWGRMAWQLGGKKAYEVIRASDEKGTSPGSDDLVKLFKSIGPCLILIDEWVAFIRETWQRDDLPAGTFDANLTFAQKLTEAVKATPDALLVASLPQSQIEVGSEGGAEALARLENTFGRLEFNWRPANQAESYEIVRRRLFAPITEQDLFAARDAVVSAYAEMYRGGKGDYPSETGEMDYQRRLEHAYPIHPELFDRLYNDWSTLEEFQRTRGVLRLMATVIHTLWVRGDKSLTIMPSMLPIDEPTVQSELTRYLSDAWPPIIEQDVDGPDALPMRVDKETSRFGKVSAARRVARTVYMGSAPVPERANKGVDMRHVRLGCVQPGESAAIFGDALRQLTDSSSYLYADGSRYWYDNQPNVNRTAADRAAQQGAEDVDEEIRRRLRDQQKKRGQFAGVHVCPDSTGEVLDDRTVRLVILSPPATHWRNAEDGPGLAAAKELLEKRGNSPRLFRNTLIFLAPDRTAIEHLRERVRSYLAWDSIVSDAEALDLTPLNKRLATKQQQDANRAVETLLCEAYGWLLVPKQPNPLGPIEFDAVRQSAPEPMAERAGNRLKRDGLLNTTWAGTLLRKSLDERLWQDRKHIKVRELADYFAQYVYLDRLRDTEVLFGAIRDGVAGLTWRTDGFAYADEWDEKAGRYRGLKAGDSGITVRSDDVAVVVRADIAAAQLEKEKPVPAGGGAGPEPPAGGAGSGGPVAPPVPPPALKRRRFYAASELDSLRVGKAASQIAEHVVAFLIARGDTEVTVKLSIEAKSADGFDDTTVRTILENCRTLKFQVSEFEQE